MYIVRAFSVALSLHRTNLHPKCLIKFCDFVLFFFVDYRLQFVEKSIKNRSAQNYKHFSLLRLIEFRVRFDF